MNWETLVTTPEFEKSGHLKPKPSTHARGRLLSRAVPNMENLHTASALGNVVEDSILAINDFTQRTASPAGIRGTNEWERSQNANVVNDTMPDQRRGLGIKSCDVGTNIVEIRNRSVRPDYFEAHADAQDSSICSASTWVFERPFEISSRPRLMAAITFNSPAISSREAFSGSRLIASSTACLSVIRDTLTLALRERKTPRLQVLSTAPGGFLPATHLLNDSPAHHWLTPPSSVLASRLDIFRWRPASRGRGRSR